jgi:hypothetical protein
MEVDRPLSFRDFPWRWRDVLMGYLPLVLAPAILVPLRHVFLNAPSWTWIASSYASGIWMFAYPVYVVRKRAGLPKWPRPRMMVRLTLLAIPLVVTAFVIAALVSSGVTSPEPSVIYGSLG